MKGFFRTGICLVAFLMLCASPAAAAGKGTYVVLPFAIQGPQGFAYLERSIPQMLTSRLYWKGQVEPAVGDLPASQGPAADQATAEKARAAYRADYVIWGSVTIVGDDCSLDVRVRSRDGQVWPYAREAKSNQLIGAIKGVSDTINREVFGRNTAPSGAVQEQAGSVNQMNPDLVINETTPRDVYLNPQFRYSGSAGDGTRIQSQTLQYTAIGMEVVDADGDGRNEIFVLSDSHIYAYRFDANGRLVPLGEFKFPTTADCLSVRSFDRRSGRPWLIVNMVDKSGAPIASILTFDGKAFKEEMKNLPYFLNVVKMPPTYQPQLLGQQSQPPKLFRTGVHEMIPTGNSLSPGSRIALPEYANVLNFAYLPAGRGEQDGEKIIVLNEAEHLLTYTSKGARLAESPETYSGSAKGLGIDPNMPGMGYERVTLRSMFYIPMRMLPVDLDRDGNYELIVNRPISTASRLFDRYRFFPQSEIHSLFWDGVGLNLQWKTRRIKGSMADYAIADANNDGIVDLVTCVNTHPGALGTAQRRALIVLYPLDLAKTQGGADTTDFYDD